MVLGLKTKRKKGASCKIDYIIHVQEIKPWPPSESLKSIQTVLLQWENGDQNSGSFLTVAGDSNIVFNETFMLPLTLFRDKKAPDKFVKNFVEFSLFEPRKDKPKGTLLGTASLNIADYGVIEDVLSVNVPVNFRKSSNNLVQSVLSISLEPTEHDGSNSSYMDYEDNESEIASFTDDDDASSHSSRTAGSFPASPSRNDKDVYGISGIESIKAPTRSSNNWSRINDFVSSSKFSERSMISVKNNFSGPLIISSPTSTSFRDTNDKSNNIAASFKQESAHNTHEVIANSKNKTANSNGDETSSYPFEAVPMNAARVSEDPSRRLIAMRSDTLVPNRKAPAVPPSGINKARLKHVKSVQIHGSVNGNGFVADVGKRSEPDIPNGSKKKVSAEVEKKEIAESKNEWKIRVEMLEEELREIAAIEIGLYSVVAEHASSGNKLHAPARRIARFYTKACRPGSQGKRASAARAAVSGLVLVSKACGNDVPRLTFWLSNTIMLRAIVSQTAAEMPNSNLEGNKSKQVEESDDFEDVMAFIIALEKVESWLFCRIVESLWWQTFTPHMQSTGGSSQTSSTNVNKTRGKRNTLANYEQANQSMELWKKAFKEASERLCPIRAGGHECGCLSVLLKLVMEQLVNRLDMAMFNAILRESAEEMPTDPVSDPICDTKVLPIPSGKSSFGAGAQLKNAIGNWSRWLSDLFGLDEDSGEVTDAYGDGKSPKEFKAFHLLHSLSDLMMLPFGMLADVSIRKEVCPAFGPVIVRRVLNNFVPDEFSPGPIPRKIIASINSEDISEASGDTLESIPCNANPTKYSPPSAALLTCIGEVGSQVLQSSRLSTINKSYNSDDELDELDSPLTSIIPDSHHTSSALSKLSLMPKEKGGRNVLRYQLLREIWNDDE